MKNIKVYLFCLIAITMSSCHGFGKIDTHGDLNQGGVSFKIIPSSDDAIEIYEIDVSTKEINHTGLVEEIWNIKSDGEKLNEFQYGILPKGFFEKTKASTLKIDTMYLVSANGTMMMGSFRASSCFYVDNAKMAKYVDC